MIGGRFNPPLNKDLRITPVVGISWWELDTKEGRFSESGRRGYQKLAR
jgi:hypothetical protein